MTYSRDVIEQFNKIEMTGRNSKIYGGFIYSQVGFSTQGNA